MDDIFLGADAEEVEKLILPEMKEKQENRVVNKDVKGRDDLCRKSRRMKQRLGKVMKRHYQARS